MENPSPSDSTRRKRRKRRRSNRLFSSIWYTLRGWWVEIVIALLVLLAIFLLVERMEIRRTFSAWLLNLIQGLQRLAISTYEGLVVFFGGSTLSDLIAYVLLIGVVGLMLWRLRWRLRASPRYTQLKCPRCGGDLHRIHRHWGDRVVNLLVPVRRYRCQNRDCRWHGLRILEARHE